MKFIADIIGRLFKKKFKIDPEVLDAEYVMQIANSQKFLVSNGRSWFSGGGDPNLYGKGRLRICLGETVSGYGDWGGGFDHAATSPVKVTIDRQMNIICMSNAAKIIVPLRPSAIVEIVDTDNINNAYRVRVDRSTVIYEVDVPQKDIEIIPDGQHGQA